MDIVFHPRPLQAFTYAKDVQVQIGHIGMFKVGSDAVLAPDLFLADPLSTEGTPSAVVGALAEVSWGGRPSSSLHLSFVVSTANRQILSNLVHQALDNTKVSFQVVVYEFDRTAAQPAYYKAFHSNSVSLDSYIKTTEVGGNEAAGDGDGDDEADEVDSDEEESLATRRARKKKQASRKKADRATGERTTELVMKLASTPEEKPHSPQVWKFDISLDPVQYDTGGTPQHIHFATASQHTIVKPWGVEKPS